MTNIFNIVALCKRVTKGCGILFSKRFGETNKYTEVALYLFKNCFFFPQKDFLYPFSQTAAI